MNAGPDPSVTSQVELEIGNHLGVFAPKPTVLVPYRTLPYRIHIGGEGVGKHAIRGGRETGQIR